MQSTKAACLLLFQLYIISITAAWAANINWTAQVEHELQTQPDKLAYCRALQRLQQQQQYEQTSCAQILQDELTMTGELLLDTPQRCWWGWELFERRCRKRV